MVDLRSVSKLFQDISQTAMKLLSESSKSKSSDKPEYQISPWHKVNRFDLDLDLPGGFEFSESDSGLKLPGLPLNRIISQDNRKISSVEMEKEKTSLKQKQSNSSQKKSKSRKSVDKNK